MNEIKHGMDPETAREEGRKSVRETLAHTLGFIAQRIDAEGLDSLEDDAVKALCSYRMGDALRVEVEIPKSIRKFFAERKDFSVLKKVLEDTTETMNKIISNPDIFVTGTSDSEEQKITHKQLVTERDQAESLYRVLVWKAVLHHLAPTDIAGFTEFCECIERYDAMLVSRGITRKAASSLLGNRFFLLEKSQSWVEKLSHPEGAKNRPFSEAEPNLESVSNYIVDGNSAEWVEGYAAQNVQFKTDLIEKIHSFIDINEEVSVRASEWLKNQQSLEN